MLKLAFLLFAFLLALAQGCSSDAEYNDCVYDCPIFELCESAACQAACEGTYCPDNCEAYGCPPGNHLEACRIDCIGGGEYHTCSDAGLLSLF